VSRRARSCLSRALTRTWSLLAETATPGTTSLTLKHPAEEMGWRVGDRLGVATTTRSNSTVHTILGMLGTTVGRLVRHHASPGGGGAADAVRALGRPQGH
jgi:hypothetical protein